MKKLRLKEGAPPEEDLVRRVTVNIKISERPDLTAYSPFDITYVDGTSVQLDQARTLIEVLNYDRALLEAKEISLSDLIEISDLDEDESQVVFELVDGDGNVWTEEYDED